MEVRKNIMLRFRLEDYENALNLSLCVFVVCGNVQVITSQISHWFRPEDCENIQEPSALFFMVSGDVQVMTSQISDWLHCKNSGVKFNTPVL